MTLTSVTAQTILETLIELERLPPTPTKPTNRFSLSRRHNGVVYVSSMTPRTSEGIEISGPILSGDVGLDLALLAAEWAAANSLRALCDDLNTDDATATGVLDVLVFCNSSAGFGAQSEIADAATSLMGRVFPESSDPVRGAIGAASLVRDSTVVVKASYLLSSSSSPS